ncbi:hypothetical protein A33Q_3402 [Indibacter alkaliphilus LW1]|uniref:Cytochrome c domain-containing protein n=1 Tax=Indibacter alkaliphilus (strain CCUG 57479 / KCTC 22604 / LW1) TaxID=1189612 RepID=S2D7K5_INDAL|nr:VCBS repeat-containing protein [Indibacter alkaliphilus]EOZ95197.1 hypothetical protein A33Q_3402 [Indibacter alkaliphilus LW1]
MQNISTFLLLCVFLFACSKRSESEKSDLDHVASISIAEEVMNGKTLTDAYCGACHLKPDPALLDKATWKNSVLPDMRRRMGLITEEDFGHAVGADIDAPEGIYAKQALISLSEWKMMESYYLENSPESLPDNGLDFQSIKEAENWKIIVPKTGKQRPNFTTFLRWESEEGVLYFGDRFRQVFKADVLRNDLKDSIGISSPASDIYFYGKDRYDLLTMGVMDPSNTSIGKLESYSNFSDKRVSPVLDSLTRPVHFVYEDLNQDGRQDIVISEFGHHVGQLVWYEQNDSGYTKRYFNNRPGARKTIIEDINGDGLPDVIALMTQAYEGVYVYLNQGKGKFREEKWLGFQPLFGASDMFFEDMDGDGYKDIIMVSGDNADLSIIPKPYHGVRIYKNDGQNKFTESYFQPFHGASALLVEDFNLNGRLDLAVLSYFPERENGQRNNFLYLENAGSLNFDIYKKDDLGKYNLMTMDAADISGNGKKDLILGCFDFSTSRAFPMGDWVPYIYLENNF